MTLRELEMGREARIAGFSRLSGEQSARLEALGLGRGLSVTKLLRTPLKDPVECLAGTQLVALEAWLLDHIDVRLP